MRRDLVRFFIAGICGSWLIVLAMVLLGQSVRTTGFMSASYFGACALLICIRYWWRGRRLTDESMRFRSRELRCRWARHPVPDNSV